MLNRVGWVAAVALLTACGGGSDRSPRGAVAVDSRSGYGVVVVNYTSQVEANSDAVNACGFGCSVALEFTGYRECGSLARSSNGTWGVGSGDSKEKADTRAVSACVGNGGSACFVQPDLGTQCN